MTERSRVLLVEDAARDESREGGRPGGPASHRSLRRSDPGHRLMRGFGWLPDGRIVYSMMAQGI